MWVKSFLWPILAPDSCMVMAQRHAFSICSVLNTSTLLGMIQPRMKMIVRQSWIYVGQVWPLRQSRRVAVRMSPRRHIATHPQLSLRSRFCISCDASHRLRARWRRKRKRITGSQFSGCIGRPLIGWVFRALGCNIFWSIKHKPSPQIWGANNWNDLKYCF